MRTLTEWLARVALVVGSVVVATPSANGGDFVAENRRDLTQIKRKIRAAQFLQRATFGPTEETIDELAQRMRQIGVQRACSEWIDRQFEVPPSYHEPLILDMIADDGYDPSNGSVWVQRFRNHAWWHRSLTAKDQLRQRVAWALIQILVTSQDGAGFNDLNVGDNSGVARWLGLTNYYDLMVRHAFGKYRNLLEDVTYHPIMGVYLSHMRNRKADLVANRFPDENYAREIMQLFTIGLYELRLDGRLMRDGGGNLIPTYNNETIKEFAKVFTGLSFKPNPQASGNGRFWWGNDFEYPMEMFDFEHEPGTKTLLNNEVIGHEETIDGNQDIQDALDNLMAHDNVGPFIARRLIQRLVKSNPSRAYIRRVARTFNNNGRGEKGDLKAVVKAVLLDPEVWRGLRIRTRTNPLRVQVIPRGTEYSKLAEPVIRYTRLLRAAKGESDYHTGRMMVLPMDWNWTQEPYMSPSVFNFWLPDYQPPGHLTNATPGRRIPNDFLVAPEFQLKTPVVTNRLLNRFIWDTSSLRSRHVLPDNRECNINFQLDEEMEMLEGDDDMHKLMDHFDLLLCCGTIPQDFKNRCVQVINQDTEWMKGHPTYAPRLREFRVYTALMVISTSPFCAVTE